MSRSLIVERLEEALFQIQSVLSHPVIADDETIRDEVEHLNSVVEELDDAINDVIGTLMDEHDASDMY